MLLRTNLWYSPELLRANPDHIFVFGDNLRREGRGGQAVIRYEPNAMGLATKGSPNTNDGAYFSDDSPVDMVLLLRDVVRVLLTALDRPVVIPFSTSVELGTGLSQLPERAPKLYSFLNAIFTEDMPVAELVQ